MRSKKEQQLLERLEEAAATRGFDLVDIECTGSGRTAVVRVYLNRPEGLTLDAVAGANEWISEVVESVDPFKGSYTLEVSSPGVNRSLRTLEHFVQAVGEEVSISLDDNLVGRGDPAAHGGQSVQAEQSEQAGQNAQVEKGEQAEQAKLVARDEQGKQEKLRLKYVGIIIRVDPETRRITVESEGSSHILEFDHIKKAKVKGRISFEGRKDS